MMKAQMKKVKQTEEYLEGLLKADAGVFKTMVLDVVSLAPFSGRGGEGPLKGLESSDGGWGSSKGWGNQSGGWGNSKCTRACHATKG